jgi:hypothetical protein
MSESNIVSILEIVKCALFEHPFAYSCLHMYRHIITLLGLAAILWMAMLSFPSVGPLYALPPYITVVALIGLLLHELVNQGNVGRPRQMPVDEEQGRDSRTIVDRRHFDEATTAARTMFAEDRPRRDINNTSTHSIHRSSHAGTNALPHPSNFSTHTDCDEFGFIASDDRDTDGPFQTIG